MRDGRRHSGAHVMSGGPQPGSVVRAKIRVPATDALPRERLEAALAGAIEHHRLTLVIAPAGSGKTTLLARFASAATLPIAWYRAESWDDEPDRLVRHLEAALAAVLPGLPTGWTDVEAAAAALESVDGPAVLIVDDLHALEGSAAESALGRLLDYAPPWLRVVAGSRSRPNLNLSRLRVSGDLYELEGDDLRFRSWEVERLFRDFYGESVPPSELAVLARRTEGWAAGLQLFHLATRGKTAEDRRRVLASVGSGTRLLREYLTRNVLAELPDELRRFLIETSPLPRLTGELCDRLLGRNGSAQLLEELARRQIFTVEIDELDGAYRYHEVLRSHLDRMLVEDAGEVEARERHRRAAALLEESRGLPEALAAYCRAEDWVAVGRLLGDRGHEVATGSGLRLELLPPALVRDNPWLALASARQARAEGRWASAIEAYVRAESGFARAPTGAVARSERATIASWLDPGVIPQGGWPAVLRAGLIRDPLSPGRDARQLDDSHRLFVRGLLALAAGELTVARRSLDEVSRSDDLDIQVGAAAAVAAAVAAVLQGDAAGDLLIAEAVDAAERANASWLARVGRLAGRLAGEGNARTAPAFDPDADPWGAALEALADAWLPAIAAGGADEVSDARLAAAERAALAFRRLGAGVLEALARGLAAYAQASSGTPDAREAALAVERLARLTGTSAPRVLAYAALASVDPNRRFEYEAFIEAIKRETGFTPPSEPSTPARPTREADISDRGFDGAGSGVVEFKSQRKEAGLDRAGSGLRIKAFGRFFLGVGDEAIAIEHVKPRARALLRFLAIRPGLAMHREVIQEALWCDADAQTAARSLHVAVSALRRLMTEALGPAGIRLIEREGDAYRLAVDQSQVDVGAFENAIARARASKASGGGAEDYTTALGLYVDDLLPQDGPAEWVVERREHLRRDAVEAATALADEALGAGELTAAIRYGRRGLELDRFNDPLWRVVIAARELAGDPGAARRDRQEYVAVLEGLGIDREAANSSV